MRHQPLLLVAVSMILSGCVSQPASSDAGWFKGNTHAHTLWSDGDGAPELVADWYVEHDYDFLVLSDHNILSAGERWFTIDETGRLHPDHVAALQERFGTDAVVIREDNGRRQMRLVTLEELRGRFEQPNEFLFIQGEEITDSYERTPVHINGLNLAEVINPDGGSSVSDVMNRNVQAVYDQGQRLDRPTLAHINHPNYGWAFTWQDVASIRHDRFFEVYNGHSAVHNAGDHEHDSMERVWDRAIVLRLTELDLGLLYGLATDDGHNSHEMRVGRANPGRGWIMVRSHELSADGLLGALHAGDFYASSGVVINDVNSGHHHYSVDIAAQAGVGYTTRFYGTRMVVDEPGPVGELLHETTDNPAVYELQGDELYVRATVTSTTLHPNPHAAGDLEMAWCQPVLGEAAEH
jgi:hypothetical protein